jgi:hypothetical protein
LEEAGGGGDMNAKIAREVRPKERKCYMSERRKKGSGEDYLALSDSSRRQRKRVDRTAVV